VGSVIAWSDGDSALWLGSSLPVAMLRTVQEKIRQRARKSWYVRGISDTDAIAVSMRMPMVVDAALFIVAGDYGFSFLTNGQVGSL